MQGRCTLKEKGHRNLQDMGNLLQAAGADAVRALLVFLYLLESDSERIAQLVLAHGEHLAAHAHTVADMAVGGIGSLRGSHNVLLCRNPSVTCGSSRFYTRCVILPPELLKDAIPKREAEEDWGKGEVAVGNGRSRSAAVPLLWRAACGAGHSLSDSRR